MILNKLYKLKQLTATVLPICSSHLHVNLSFPFSVCCSDWFAVHAQPVATLRLFVNSSGICFFEIVYHGEYSSVEVN